MMTDPQSSELREQLSHGASPLSHLLEQLRSVLLCDLKLHIVLLIALSCFCYFRTLGSYFIADDFPEIAYVSSIFHGRSDLFFSNFTGNYMQVPGMKVYRPGMFLTMVIDFLCYGAKASGYLLTNFLYFTGDIVVFYFLCRTLTEDWPILNSALFALFSAAFFTVNPLHCETISWMVGRGDPVSAFYYLLSLLCFVRSLSKPHVLTKSAGVALFAIALSIKEMPVALPVITSVLPFFWLHRGSFRQRIVSAVRCSFPFWLTVAVYFVIRYLCLGTLGGGYVGGVGAQQIAAMFRHWTDEDTIQRIFVPVTQELASQSVFSVSALRTLNAVAVSLACLRLLSGCWSWRWVALIATFVVTTALPIFQLWGIGPNLEGGRFYFYLSLPLAMLLPLMLFYPGERKSVFGQESKAAINPGNYGLALTALTIVTQVGLILLLAHTTFKTNLLWVHAGKEDFHVQQECLSLAQNIDKQKRILVLGIPDDFHGAHLILNRTMFDVMLRPPFVHDSVADRFLTTMPLMYGPEQYVNASRLKELLSASDVDGPYVWRRDKQKFQKIDLPAAQDFADTTLPVGLYSTPFVRNERHGTNYSVFLDKLDLNPLAVDTIELNLDVTDPSGEPIKVYWNGQINVLAEDKNDFCAEELFKKNGSQKIRIRLGHYWRWYSCGRIKSLELVFPHAEGYRIKEVRLLAASAVAPRLTFSSGDKYLAALSSNSIGLALNKANVRNVASMQLEVGKNNYFFDNFQGTGDQEAVAFKLPIKADSAAFVLDDLTKYFPYSGYYQLRLHCLDKNSSAVGEYSDPVTVLR